MERPNPEKLSILKDLARELAREDDEHPESRLLMRLAARLVAPSDRNRAELESLLAEEKIRLALRSAKDDEEVKWLEEHGSDDLEDQLDDLFNEADE
jgi:hypothetical protein